MVLTREESDSLAALSGTTGTAATVYKVLSCKREGDVDDETDVRNIETTSGNVGGNKNVDLASLESVQCLEAGTLVEITVQTGSQVTSSLDRLLQTCSLLLVEREHQDTGGLLRCGRSVLDVVAEVEEQSRVLLTGRFEYFNDYKGQ